MYLPIPSRIERCVNIFISFVIDVIDRTYLVFGQNARVVVQTEEIRATLNYQLLLFSEFW